MLHAIKTSRVVFEETVCRRVVRNALANSLVSAARWRIFGPLYFPYISAPLSLSCNSSLRSSALLSLYICTLVFLRSCVLAFLRSCVLAFLFLWGHSSSCTSRMLSIKTRKIIKEQNQPIYQGTWHELKGLWERRFGFYSWPNSSRNRNSFHRYKGLHRCSFNHYSPVKRSKS